MSYRNNGHPISAVYHFPNPVHCLANYSKLSDVIYPQSGILPCILDGLFPCPADWAIGSVGRSTGKPCITCSAALLRGASGNSFLHACFDFLPGRPRGTCKESGDLWFLEILSHPYHLQAWGVVPKQNRPESALDRKGGKRLAPHDEKNDRIIFGHL